MEAPTRIGILASARFVPVRDLATGIVEAAQGGSQHVFRRLGSSSDDARELRNWGPDGVILHSQDPGLRQMVDAIRCPVVELLPTHEEPGWGSVGIEGGKLAESAFAHLKDLGHHRLALVTDGHLRFASAALAAHRAVNGGDAPVFDYHTFASERSDVSRISALDDWLQHLDRPTGVFCLTARLASLVVQSAAACDRRVPTDLSVVSISDEEENNVLSSPSISSVEIPWATLGFQAMQQLHALIKGDCHPSRVEIEQLRVTARESTAAIAFDDPVLRIVSERIRLTARTGANVSDIVRGLSYSRRKIELAYKAATGATLLEALHDMRLERSCRLLIHTDATIALIAEQSGFTSTESFIRLFRRKKGMTPGAWRQAATESDT